MEGSQGTAIVTGPITQELISHRSTVIITVAYNEVYTVKISASNCVGSSGNARASLFEGKPIGNIFFAVSSLLIDSTLYILSLVNKCSDNFLMGIHINTVHCNIVVP